MTHLQIKQKMDSRISDCDWVVAKLKADGYVTALEAIDHGILRLGARIWDLRNKERWKAKYGALDIRTEMVRAKDGETYGRYVLVGSGNGHGVQPLH